jgi:hypothetical protein
MWEARLRGTLLADRGARCRSHRRLVDDGAWDEFLLIREDERRRGERLLSQELENGEWHRRFGHLLELEELDLGYRLVTAQL